MAFEERQARQRALEALEHIAQRFRGRAQIWPFRVPNDPVTVDLSALRPRPVLRMDWSDTRWELTAVTLPSGLHLYCDSDGHETRALASVKRGNPSEADGFLLERLAESRGAFFGIEMAGPAPDRVRSSIGDREFLADVFVELFEGTPALPVHSADFRIDVVRWLDRVLTCPPSARAQPRLADARE